MTRSSAVAVIADRTAFNHYTTACGIATDSCQE